MKTNLWKSGALALALGSVLALPSLAQAQTSYQTRETRRQQREYRRQQRLNNRTYNNNGVYSNNRVYNNNGVYSNNRVYNNNNRVYNNGVYGNRYNSNRVVYTGTVTRRVSATQFDVRISGRTYNVYTSNAVPRGLDRDDLVRITGQRVGSNDIRYANATLIRNR